MSWVLGGLLFVQPEGYYEAAHDAVHLVGPNGRVQRVQSFITCQPLPREGEKEARPLHCTLRVSPFEVVSEFQSFKHVDVYPSNEMQEATAALEHQVPKTHCSNGYLSLLLSTNPQATLEPTLVLTNALPYAVRLDVWELPEDTLTHHLQHRFDGSPVVPVASLYAALGYRPRAARSLAASLEGGSLVHSSSLQEAGVSLDLLGPAEGRHYEVYVRAGSTAVCFGF